MSQVKVSTIISFGYPARRNRTNCSQVALPRDRISSRRPRGYRSPFFQPFHPVLVI
jgi:hypothetical protein